MRISDYCGLGSALTAAALVALIEVNTIEVSVTLLAIIATAGILGFARPRYFWLWSIFIGSAVVAAYAACLLLRIEPRSWPEPGGALCYAAIEVVTMSVAMLAGRLGAALANATRKVPQ